MSPRVVCIRPIDRPWRSEPAVYRQVSTYILSEIFRDGATVGSRLPSEDALARLCAVTRTTVRRALQDLRERDMVAARRGAGSIYNGRGIQADPVRGFLDRAGAIAFWDALEGLEQCVDGAPSPALRLLLPEARALVCHRLAENREAVRTAFVEAFVPRQRAAGNARPRDIVARHVRQTRTLFSFAATRRVADALSIQPNDPVMLCEEAFFEADGRCAMVADIWRPGRHYAVRLDLTEAGDATARS